MTPALTIERSHLLRDFPARGFHPNSRGTQASPPVHPSTAAPRLLGCILREAHPLVASFLELFHVTRLWLGDYVIIPNHVHLLAQPFRGVSLEEWLYSVKRFSATQILNGHAKTTVTHKGHLWQIESFDRVVRDGDELARTRAYIANNPAKLQTGTFVYKAMDWLDEFAPS